MTQAEHPTSLAALRARYGVRYRWLLLLAVMVGTMASIMSSTIVNVAIPGMSQHFALGQERAQWVSQRLHGGDDRLDADHALAAGALRLPPHVCRLHAAAAGGRRGGRLSPTASSLVLAARVAEGLAAGVVQPIPAIIILRAFEPNEQGRASGIFGMGVVLAPALGPSIGGVLVDWFGWRSIFFMVVPFCLASLWLAYRFVPVTAPGGVAANRDGAPWTGAACCWPVPARCACSTAWWNCTAATAAGAGATAGRRRGLALAGFIALAAPAASRSRTGASR
jgi:MFS family permease